MSTLPDGVPSPQALPLRCASCGFFPGLEHGAVRHYSTTAAVGDFPAGTRLVLCDDCSRDHQHLLEPVEPTADEQAVDWLLRLRQLRAQGHDFDTALAITNREAGRTPDPEGAR